MSYTDALARVDALQSLAFRSLAPLAAPAVTATRTTTPVTTATTPGSFASALQSAWLNTDLAGDGTAGARALTAAQGELGVSEEPPGSNDSPRIAQYRTATQGAYAGAPWCAYFVSWAAAQAGTPIGANGSGLGSVEGVRAWAEGAGKLLPQGAQPQPGDLILFGGAHIGIVESVNPDGSLVTVEGNHSHKVDRVNRSRGEATDFVRL
jgi:hypothetical protein